MPIIRNQPQTKIKPGDRFVVVNLVKGEIVVSTEMEVTATALDRNGRNVSVSFEEFYAGGNRYNVKNLWPCPASGLTDAAPAQHADVCSPFVYALVADQLRASEDLCQQYLEAADVTREDLEHVLARLKQNVIAARATHSALEIKNRQLA